MPPKKYTHLSQRNQILKRPAQHIGSTKKATRNTWIVETTVDPDANEENTVDRIVQQEVEYVPGLLHIFYEVLSNAQDNYFHSLSTEHPLRKIEVTVDQTTGEISVWNDGCWIPNTIHKWSADEEVIDDKPHYEAEIIFGHLNSSSNYNDDEQQRSGGGLHGVGVKLTNIFSKIFKVECFDPETGIRFRQEYNNSMSDVKAPQITTLKQKKGYTRVSYVADFALFGVDGYTETDLQIIRKMCFDCAMITGQKVIFNGEPIPVKSLAGYSGCYTDTNSIEFKSDDSTVVLCEKPAYEPGLVQISFVNGISTERGGIHLNAWKKAIFTPLLEKLKTKFTPKGKHSTPFKMTAKTLESYFMIFVNCNLPNPEFEGQTKSILTNPSPTVNVPPSKITALMKWDFVKEVEETIRVQGIKELSKTDGKKSAKVNIAGADDANLAGKAKSKDCTLVIVEGLSAKTFVVTGISAVPNGTDWYGILPVRGKVLNVRDAGTEQINNNKEITNIKTMLGLRAGLDYTKEENYKTLRYGKVIILTDADFDGNHIKGLIINFFMYFYPSLVTRGYLWNIRTPIVKATIGKKTLSFYHPIEFKNWAAKQKTHFTAKYYKGLGTSTDAEIIEIFEAPKNAAYTLDDVANETVDMAFSKKRANDRKRWLEEYQEREISYDIDDLGDEIVPISDFINNELRAFSIYDNKRSIPSVIDGLKTVQRKALWGGFKKLSLTADYKVAQFAGDVAKISEYHHGEVSMQEAIIGMAQTFVGSNNISVFYESGQYGCVAPDTPILLWNSEIKKAQDINVGDKLVGDDGKERHVSKIVSGMDEMYEISQTHGDTYIVNSEHILTLRYSGHKSIYWKESAKAWKCEYFDIKTKKAKSIHVTTNENKTKYTNHPNKTTLSKEEAYEKINKLVSAIPDDDIFDISVKDYINLGSVAKHEFKGIVNSTCVEWPKQNVPIDPYVFGLWLGDGDHGGGGFTTADYEIAEQWCIWADSIGAEVVHHTNGEDHENYHYGIRRRGSGYRTAIGSPDHNSKECIGCQTSKKKNPICDWVFEHKSTDNVLINGVAINNMRRTDFNPFKEILKRHGLYKNKRIPTEYIFNDKETRLKVLAGFIDTDGTIHNQGGTYNAVITQSTSLHGHLLESLLILSRSLGFRANLTRYEKLDQSNLFISGNNLHDIPTRLPHKQILKHDRKKNRYNRAIKVKPIGVGKYCGWHIDGNERFLLGDFTITHNTRLSGGKDAAAGRYIFTRLQSITRYIFRKEDDPILEYLEEEGAQIEPKFYVPVIPMLLVNGSSGIGTGYSTDIPCFNPLDLVKWIRVWLDHGDCSADNETQFPDLIPWYRGFTGHTTQESATKFVHYGTVEKVADYYHITELPIRVWTDDYKDLLNTLQSGVPAKDTKTGYDALTVAQLKAELAERELTMSGTKKVLIDRLKAYDKENGTTVKKSATVGQLVNKWENHSDVYTVDFKVWTKGDVTIDYENPKFKLTTVDNLTNMTAFTPIGALKKYQTLVDILNTFCNVRFDFYKKRKEQLLSKLQVDLLIAETKARFVAAVLNDFELLRQTEAQLFEWLAKEKYYAKDGSYRYLTDMPIRTINTPNKCETLAKEIADLFDEIEYVTRLEEKSMWTTELDEFTIAYEEWKTSIEKVNKRTPKVAASGKRGKKKV